MGSLGLFLQCATSTFFSLVMSRLVRHFGSRWVYLSSMASFTASTLVICLSESVVLITVMAALTGYAYATLQTLPYTLTCHYHKEREVRTGFRARRRVTSRPDVDAFSRSRSSCEKRKPKASRKRAPPSGILCI